MLLCANVCTVKTAYSLQRIQMTSHDYYFLTSVDIFPRDLKKLKKVITCIIIKVIKVKVVIIMNYYYFHPRLSILPRDCEKEIIKRHKIMEWK